MGKTMFTKQNDEVQCRFSKKQIQTSDDMEIDEALDCDFSSVGQDYQAVVFCSNEYDEMHIEKVLLSVEGIISSVVKEENGMVRFMHFLQKNFLNIETLLVNIRVLVLNLFKKFSRI